MNGQALAFLSALFGEDALEDSWMYLWTLPGKRTHWFRSVAEAAKAAESFKGVNVYVGLGLSPENFGPDRRCLNEEVAALSGVRADIDIANGVAHSKANLPPDLAAARKILARLALQPTMIVHSGYGLQAYWLFKETWTLDNDVERAEAAALLRGWNEAVRSAAREVGNWDVDATHDLARVFRVPGSFNVKDPANPKPVTILEHHDERRYNPSDVEEAIPGDLSSYAVELRRDKNHLPVELKRNPTLNYLMMETMAEEVPKWKKTWNRKRKDLADNSLSAYDASLASMAAHAGWSDQQIADLIVAFRQKHGNDKDVKKAYRLDYISNTIRMARRSAEGDKAESEMNGRIDRAYAETQADVNAPAEKSPETGPGRVESERVTVDPEKCAESLTTQQETKRMDKDTEKSRRSERFDAVSEKLGVKIANVIHYDGETVQFVVEIVVKGEVVTAPMGNSDNILTYRRFQRRVADHALVALPDKVKDWHKIASILISNAERRRSGEEARVEGAVKGQLLAYLHQKSVCRDWQGTAINKTPFVKDGRVYVYLDGVLRFMAQNGDKVGRKDMGQQLRRAGCESLTVAGYEVNGSPTTRNVFVLPDWPELAEVEVRDQTPRDFDKP